MDEVTRQLHLDAGRRYGREATCGVKIDYKSEASAQRAATKMMAKGSKELEAYPCAWCDGWHIGRKMSEEELYREATMNRDHAHHKRDQEDAEEQLSALVQAMRDLAATWQMRDGAGSCADELLETLNQVVSP